MEENKVKDLKEVRHEPKEKVSAIQWIKNELTINKELLSIKLALFLFVGGVTSFLPYLTLHMQEVGLDMKQIAIIYAVLPVAALSGPFLSGLIADSSGHYTTVINFNMLMTLVFHSLLIFIPHPTTNYLELNCNSHNYSLKWKRCENEFTPQDQISYLSFENCVFDCSSDSAEKLEICFSREGINGSHCINDNFTNPVVPIDAELLSVDESNCSQTLINIQIGDEAYDNLHCHHPCPVKCTIGNTTTNDEELMGYSAQTYFYIYFVIRIIATLALAGSFCMMDAVVLAKIEEVGGDFGKQRMVSVLSQACMPFLAGLLVDVTNGEGASSVNYDAAFYLGDALLFITVLILSNMELKVEKAGDGVFKDLLKLLMNIEITMFLIIITFLGCCWGFLETYLFVYLNHLGAPTYLLGLTLTIGSAFGLPAMFCSDLIVEKLGRGTIFFLSFIAYFIRFTGYSYIPTAWYCFPFELLEVITYQIMWVAAATYCPILAPQNLLASMTGVAGACHYSLGRGLGSFIGGYFISEYGLKLTFRGFGYACLIGGFLHAVIHKFVLQKKEIQRKKVLAFANSFDVQTTTERKSSALLVAKMQNTSRRSSLAM